MQSDMEQRIVLVLKKETLLLISHNMFSTSFEGCILLLDVTDIMSVTDDFFSLNDDDDVINAFVEFGSFCDSKTVLSSFCQLLLFCHDKCFYQVIIRSLLSLI